MFAYACHSKEILRSIRFHPTWSCPGSIPVLRSGEVHVWLLPRHNPSYIQSPSSPSPDGKSSLNACGRGLSHVCPDTQSALVYLLTQYLGCCPNTLSIRKSFSGKPKCHRMQGGSNLHLSLSHSCGWTLLALQYGSPLGLDLERMRKPVHAERLVQYVFGTAIQTRLPLPSLSEAARTRRFVRDWTGMEAVLKLFDRSLIEVISSHQKNIMLHALPPPASFYVCRFGIGVDHFASLALVRRPRSIRFLMHPECQRPQ